MTKKTRLKVLAKYNNHCAYCGKVLEYKNMQVDHLIPKQGIRWSTKAETKINHIDNFMPSCSRCNHYKRAHSLKKFRQLLCTLKDRVKDIYICKVAIDYGIINIKEFDGVFYFEKFEKGEV